MYGKQSFIALLLLTLMSCQGDSTSKQKLSVEEKQLVSLISGYHGIAAAEQWHKLPPESVERIITLYPKLSDVTAWQLRLLDSLQHFPGERSTHFLSKLADDPRNPSINRRQALQTLSKLAVNLQHWQHDPDPKVRQTAVRLLRQRFYQPQRQAMAQAGGAHRKLLQLQPSK